MSYALNKNVDRKGDRLPEHWCRTPLASRIEILEGIACGYGNPFKVGMASYLNDQERSDVLRHLLHSKCITRDAFDHYIRKSWFRSCVPMAGREAPRSTKPSDDYSGIEMKIIAFDEVDKVNPELLKKLARPRPSAFDHGADALRYGMGGYDRLYSGGLGGGKSILQQLLAKNTIMQDLKFKLEPGQRFYEPPNGGMRILPSAYTVLRTDWYRSNGGALKPTKMNDGHLVNTIKLLNESHGNLIDKSTALLGKMAQHFRNQPDIVRALAELCLNMQQVDVDELYPIFTVLQAEYHQRMQAIPLSDEDVMFSELRDSDDDLARW